MSGVKRSTILRAVQDAYASNPDALGNGALYRSVMDETGISQLEFWEQTPVGNQGLKRSLSARAVRWAQQTMKTEGLLEHVPGERGLWRLTGKGKQKLCQVRRGTVLVAFHTDLGLALWADCRDAFKGLDEPIMCVITSPPFPLARPRTYGNPTAEQYVDFLCTALEPVIERLAPGGSIVLNLSNDIFVPGTPARNLYLERVVIALHDRFRLEMMDRLVWHNTSKPPGPVRYASLDRTQLNHGYEFLYWFTNDPSKVRSDNRRVLLPHSEKHLKFIRSGGIKKASVSGDGAHKKLLGKFGVETPGKIPRNVISMSAACGDQRRYKAAARALGLPVHGAPMPLRLADFLVRLLTLKDELVADPFGGSLTTAKACENSGRRWIVTETAGEYLRGSAERFRASPGLWLNPLLDEALGIAA